MQPHQASCCAIVLCHHAVPSCCAKPQRAHTFVLRYPLLLLPPQSAHAFPSNCAFAGAISEPQVVTQFLALLAGGLGVSYTLDRWAGHDFPIMLCLALGGSFISYIYSAPPLKLKQSGWIGNYALGSSYIALPWWAGQVGNYYCH